MVHLRQIFVLFMYERTDNFIRKDFQEISTLSCFGENKPQTNYYPTGFT